MDPHYPSRLLLFALIGITLCCNQHPTVAVSIEKEIAASKAAAEKGAIGFEGRFDRLEKLDARYYTLVLLDSTNQKDSFVTLMPLSKTEIALLKKTGNNIILNYRNYFNPVRKTTEKLVLFMIPIYDLNKK